MLGIRLGRKNGGPSRCREPLTHDSWPTAHGPRFTTGANGRAASLVVCGPCAALRSKAESAKLHSVSKTRMKERQAARQKRAARVQASIAAAVDCPLCPNITAETGLEILTKTLSPGRGRKWWTTTKAVQGNATRLSSDLAWRERALEWIDAYQTAHGHGPSWREFWRAPSLWPDEATAALLSAVVRQLNEGGWLDGTKTPFALCRRAGK